jgi:hypothetical protein
MTHKSNQQDRTFPIKEICGAIHLHTTFSDGGVDYPVLINTAKTVGLDFIVVTDHSSLGGRDAGYEGFQGDLFVCVGYEHCDSGNINHYLAIGCDSVTGAHESPQEYINSIRAGGGIGFIAHPIEKRHYFEKYPPYPWTAWNAQGFDGIELWNQMSDWLENLRSWLNFIRLFYPRRFLVEIPGELLARWDTLNRTRFVSGIGGVDAHTMKMRFGLFHFTVFPIKVELKGIRTHIYLEKPLPKNDIARAKAIFLEALKNGRGFISNYRRGDAKGTKIFLQDSAGRCIPPGGNSGDVALPARITVQCNESVQVRLIYNGRRIGVREGKDVEFPVTANGLYRIEVFKGKYAWIYSNPFPVGLYPL